MNKIISLILIISFLTSQIGCANKDYINAHQEFAKTEAIRFENAPEVLRIVLIDVVNTFASTVESNIGIENSRKPIYSKTTTLVNGEVVTEEVYSETNMVLAFFMEQERIRAKKEMIEFLLPIVKEILTQKQMELDRPVTAWDVLLEVAKNTPLIATVLGFYGITGALADKIGTKISSNLTNGSSININSDGNRAIYNSPVFEAAPAE